MSSFSKLTKTKVDEEGSSTYILLNGRIIGLEEEDAMPSQHGPVLDPLHEDERNAKQPLIEDEKVLGKGAFIQRTFCDFFSSQLSQNFFASCSEKDAAAIAVE